MFNTKNKSKTTNSEPKEKTFATVKSWIEGDLGSVLIGSAIGYSLYKFGIIKQLTDYLTNLTKTTPKQPETPTQS